MVGLTALAEPVIRLLLTEKWMGIVPLLQILCIAWMYDHISAINLNLLFVKGHSDWALKLEFIKKTIATTILFASIPFGLEGMCWGRVLYSLIATYLNSHYTKSLIGLSFRQQMKDILPSMTLSFVMGGVVWGISGLIPSSALQLAAGTCTGIAFYLLAAWGCKMDSFKEIIKLTRK